VIMEALENPTPADIAATVAKARNAMPAYTDMLTFYEAIFKVQAERQDEARPSPILIDAQRAALFWKEGFPLVGPAELPVDLAHGADLLAHLCRAVEGLKSEPARSAATICNALDAERLTAKTLLEARLEKDPSRFDTIAAELSVRSEVLAFLVDQSLTPSRVAGRRQIAAHLKVDPEWRNGYCPICGSPAALGDLEENGQRHLYCGFCWHRWPFQRVRCVQCGQADPAKLYYLHSDEEPAYRVDACDACRHYIKTVDRRLLGWPLFPPLEQVLTTHLDLLAVEEGLSLPTTAISPPSS
jgi:FdhE protein